VTRTIGVWHPVMLAATMIIFGGLSVPQLTASVVAVGTCVANVVQFTTIQGAVTAVPPGSTIKICPAKYPEQVVTNKNLTLVGVDSGSADNPVLVKPLGGFVPNTASLTTGHPIAAQILVQSPATAVTISSLAVDGSNNNLNGGCDDARLIGIYYQNASGTVNFVAARNQAQDAANFGCQTSAGLGIYVESASPSTSTVKIQNSTVRDYQKNGITGNEVGTTVTITGNSVVGAGPTTTAQNGIQVGFGATGKVQNNTVADDDFNGDPAAGTGSGILIYDSGNMTITGNSVTNTQNGIAIVTDGAFPADHNAVSNNRVSDTHLGDGIDVCSNHNTVSGNMLFSSGQAGIHLNSSCGSTGNHNIVSKNTVNEACAGILLGSGTGNTFPIANLVANVANTSLVGNVCTPAVLTVSRVDSQGRSSSPARP
jgi:parallel beta-helix repeat protein